MLDKSKTRADVIVPRAVTFVTMILLTSAALAPFEPDAQSYDQKVFAAEMRWRAIGP